jgi:glutamine cyclotransferase
MYSYSALVPTAFRIVRKYPHDTMAFTQGLMWHGDRLYEGTGMRGSSVLSIVNISRGTWAVEKQVREHAEGRRRRE